MFSHITIGTTDLKSAERFYNLLLSPLGFKQRRVSADGGPSSCCWVVGNDTLPRFYVYEPFNGEIAGVANGSMIAFLASSRDAVHLAYDAGIQAGGTCEGEPGERKHYGTGYYGAYLRDLDGHKVHIVYRGDI